MRFYLLYKNHGLYDPVLDDTEYIYVPIEPQEQDNNRTDPRNETLTENSTSKNSTIQEPLNVPELDEKIKSKANLHEALLKISAGDLPESARFKLPISDEYDPEGKKITKLQKLYANNITAIDLKMIIEKIKQQEENKVTEKDIAFTHTLPPKSQFQSEEEMTKNEVQYSPLEKDINLETLKQAASRVVADSIDRAVSLAKEIKQEIDVELEKTQNLNNRSKVIKDSLFSDSKSLIKSRAEKDITTNKDSTIDVSEIHKEEIRNKQKEKGILNIAEEIQKFESLNAHMDSKVNLEERRLLAKQDVTETIEEGTVRRRSEIFTKEMNIPNNLTRKTDSSSELLSKSLDQTIPLPNLNKSYIHEDINNIKSDTKEIQQKAFTLGVQTVPRVRQALLSSYNSNLLLKTFFLQLTTVMVALTKILTLEQGMNTLPCSEEPMQIEKVTENIKQKDKRTTMQEEDKEIYNSINVNSEEQIIKKEKLTGAKIAQIEGNKPAELTDKMDIVISELLEKTILEDHSDNEDFFQKASQSHSINKEEDKNSKNYNNKDAQHDHFFDQRGKHFDRRKLYEILEEKTKTMEIKEMISKKYTREYKSMRTNKQNGNIIYYVALVVAKHFPNFEEIKRVQNLYEHKIKTEMSNDENVVYVAIVEAHSNINEEAILEEQIRRQLESEMLLNKQSIKSKDRKNIESIEIATQELSFPNTDIIEPLKFSVIPMEHKLIKFARSATHMEQISKKIAVQNIVHAIEPLLRYESQKMYKKQTLPVVEMPMKKICETMNVKVEEPQTFFKAEVSVKQRSFVSIEKPESVVEIIEITTEEDKNMPVEISKPILSEPRFAIDIAGKAVAEVLEIQTDEVNKEILATPPMINKKPSILMEKPKLSAVETITATAEYKNDDIIIPNVVSGQAKIKMETNIAAEISEVCAIEKEYDTLNSNTQIVSTQSEPVIETPLLTIPKNICIATEGPKENIFTIPEAEKQLPNVDIIQLKYLISNIVIPEEPQENIDLLEMPTKLAQILMEKCSLVLALTLAIFLNGPMEGNVDIPSVVANHAKILIEMPKLGVAEIITMFLEEPKEKDLKIPAITLEQGRILIKGFRSLIKTLAIPIDQCVALELQKVEYEMAQVSMETQFLNVAMILSILLAGPKEQIYKTAILNARQARIKMELLNLTAPEVNVTFFFEPTCENFDFTKTIANYANTVFTQLEALFTSYTYAMESKEQDIEIQTVMKKLPQVTIENCLFAPIFITIETIGPKEDIVKITKPKCEKSFTSFTTFKAIQVKIMTLGECVNENLKVPHINTKKSQLSIEDVNLHIANVLTIYLEEPRDEPFNIDTKIKHEARVKIEEQKAAEVKFIPIEEPEPVELIISELNKKQIQTSLQSSSLILAQNSAISAVESVHSDVNILKTAKQKAAINIETLKSAESVITLPEEPIEQKIMKTQSTNKTILCSVTDTNLKAAETSIVQVEESENKGLGLKPVRNLKANVKIEEHKALETTSINIIEPENETFEIQLAENKHINTMIEKPVKTIAQVMMINTDEFESELDTIETTNTYKHAEFEVESVTSVVQQNIINAMEITHDVNQRLSFIPKCARSSIVESSTNATAKIAEKQPEVNVVLEKPKSRPTIIENIEIEANFKIPTLLDDSLNEVSAEYSVKVPHEENVYVEFGFGERKMDVDTVSEIYESIRLMKKQAFQKQSMEASLSLAKELQTKIEMAEIDTLQEEFIKSGSISNSSSIASSPLTPILEEYFFNVKGPSLMSRYQHFQDVFEEASLRLKSKIQTSTIQNLDASLTLILQDLAMAHLESESNETEVIEIDDYEDIRNLHFSSALVARSQKQSVGSFLSTEAQSLKTMYQSSASRSAYGYSMSVEDLELKEFIESSSDESSHVSRKSSAIQSLTKQGMAKNTSKKSVKFADTEQYAKLQSSVKLRTSEVSEMKDNMHCELDIETSETSNVGAAISRKIFKDNESLDVSSASIQSKAIERSLEDSTTMKSSSLMTTSIEESSIKMSSAKEADLEIQSQGFGSTSERSTKSHKILSIKTDLKGKEGIDLKSPSPPALPPTPLTDEYMFRLQTKMPEPSEFVPRDCSLSPESVEDDIILKGGLIPRIKTRIERILYSPPYITPPTSPDKTVPVYSRGGGNSGIFKFLS